jgi:hypothetical protein
MAESQSTTYNPYALNVVRTFINYGFYIQGATSSDPVFTKGWINSTPNILIKGNTCYIDYSHVYDVSDRVYLNRTFGSFTGGSGKTFYFSPTEYFDEETNSRYTVGGTCNFSQSLNQSRIIVATIGSGFTGNTNYNYYSKENFTSIPQYTFTDSGKTGYYYMINSMPELSPTGFINCGALGTAFDTEDYVQISGGTAENYGRIPIYGSTRLKDGQEIMYFTSGGTTQDFITTPTTVRIYLRGEPSLASYETSEIVTGILTINDGYGNIVDCYENQNGNQSIFRKAAVSSTRNANYFLCKSCPDLIYGNNLTVPSGPILSEFGNVLFLYIKVSQFGNTTNYILNSQSSSSRVATTSQTEFNLTNTPSNLKIDFSHPSLIGYSFSGFTDPERTISADASIQIFGPLGYNTAYVFVTANRLPTTTLYCSLKGPQTINFTITFT